MFADNKGDTARLLLPHRAGGLWYYTAVNSVFLHTHSLLGLRLWFNPPISLTEDTLRFIK